MQLFHGSERIIKQPTYGQGKFNNDYGQGFYCTEITDLAREWAVDKDRGGYVNVYDFAIEGLNVLDIADNYEQTLEWLAILLDNRRFSISSPIAFEGRKYIIDNFLQDYKRYDVIKGYRADDSYFAFAQDFLNNTISLRQLSEAMKYGGLGEQIVLKSEKAFERIRFCDFERIDYSIWYPKKEERDRLARKRYYDFDKNRYIRGDIYIMNIIEKEMKKGDICI